MEILGESIADVWEKSIIELLKSTNYPPTERGTKALELRNVLLCVKAPQKEPRVSEKYTFSKEFIENYTITMKAYWQAVKDRLRSYGPNNIDQISQIKSKLKDNWYSRRAYITLWEPDIDNQSSHPPCPVGLQFLVRDDKLHVTSTLRSNDAWMSAIPDMIALSDIQKEVATELKIDIGSYTQLSISYHIYEQDIATVQELFEDF